MRKSTHTAEYRVLRQMLAQLRQEAGLSQRALAAELGVPHSWVAKVESGERRVDLVEFCWICSACGKDVKAAVADLIGRFPRRRRIRAR